MSKKTPQPAEVHNGWIITRLGADRNITDVKAIAGRTVTAIEIQKIETAFEEETDPHPQFAVVCHQGADWFNASLADSHEDADVDFHRIVGAVDGGAPPA